MDMDIQEADTNAKEDPVVLGVEDQATEENTKAPNITGKDVAELINSVSEIVEADDNAMAGVLDEIDESVVTNGEAEKDTEDNVEKLSSESVKDPIEKCNENQENEGEETDKAEEDFELVDSGEAESRDEKEIEENSDKQVREKNDLETVTEQSEIDKSETNEEKSNSQDKSDNKNMNSETVDNVVENDSTSKSPQTNNEDNNEFSTEQEITQVDEVIEIDEVMIFAEV